MKVIKRTSENSIANVFIALTEDGRMFEFVESLQPPLPVEDKWVMILSTLFGCPSDCKFCDAGGGYKGRLSYDHLMFQINYLIRSRFPDEKINTKKFKIQFARMGDPAFNPAVLDVLEDLPERFDLPYFIPSISSIAPYGTTSFFERLLDIKKRLYKETFQLQFSIHSTDEKQRNELIPIRKWGFGTIAGYADRFFDPTGKKITLNFALSRDSILDPIVLLRFFDPEKFLIKITPVNPTFKAKANNIESLVRTGISDYPEIDAVKDAGYQVLLSIGEWEENKIGSNCGQYVNTLLQDEAKMDNAYQYCIEEVREAL